MDHRAVEVAFPTGFRHHEISHAWYRNSQDHLLILDDLASIYVFCLFAKGLRSRWGLPQERELATREQHVNDDQ